MTTMYISESLLPEEKKRNRASKSAKSSSKTDKSDKITTKISCLDLNLTRKIKKAEEVKISNALITWIFYFNKLLTSVLLASRESRERSEHSGWLPVDSRGLARSGTRDWRQVWASELEFEFFLQIQHSSRPKQEGKRLVQEGS